MSDAAEPDSALSCRKCGTIGVGDGTHGLCPTCLLAEVMTPPGSKASWEAPGVEELAAMLPQYQIEGLLGRGGMGAVYQGRQAELDRRVAIKILPANFGEDGQDYAARFKLEARAMARLKHPGIVTVYDFGQTPEGLLYFVMEFAEGMDVQAMIAQEGRLHTANAIAIAAHVCEALHYAHSHGIVHRDIKPANVVVGYDGQVRVADFGLAKVVSADANSTLTIRGTVMGTPNYLAPESLVFGTEIDHRADVYAVGVMLYHMLTGRVPYGVFEMPSFQIPGMDPRLDTIIAKAMRESPAHRYQSADAMREELVGVLTQTVAQSVAIPADGEVPSPAPAARPDRAFGSANLADERPPHDPPAAPAARRLKATMIVLGTTALLILAALAFFLADRKAADDLTAGRVSVPNAPTTLPAIPVGDPAKATKEEPFVNSLGMQFVPVPGTDVLFCIHETRFRDWAAYASETPDLRASWRVQAVDGFASIERHEDHPVAAISWEEVIDFCAWLSRKEGHSYRLPTNHEWEIAVGGGRGGGSTAPPSEPTASQIGAAFPWEGQWPPPPGAANYADTALRDQFPKRAFIEGFTDGFPTTAPVMSFKPNSLGIYDLAGNIQEWMGDWPNAGQENNRIHRGGSWASSERGRLSASYRDRNQAFSRTNDRGFRVVLERINGAAE